MKLSVARVHPTSPDTVRSGLGDRFHAEAKKHPQKIALICGEESVTYEVLDRTVTRLAQWLLRSEALRDTLGHDHRIPAQGR